MKKLIIFAAVVTSCLLANSQDKVCDAVLKEEVEQMAKEMGSEATYLKDYSIQLPKTENCDKIPEQRYSMILDNKIIYRFAIKSSSQFQNEAQLILLKPNAVNQVPDLELAKVTQKAGSGIAYFDYKVENRGLYHLCVKFTDGKEGCATAMVFFVKSVL